jgi:C4-dicarboxylate-specific signal transduction histidine kinase
MSSIFSEKKIQLSLVSLDKGTVLIQKGRLENVIKNLFMNAVEATTHGKGLILVKVRASRELLTLILADNGKGIDLEAQQKIFKPFFSTKSGDRARTVPRPQFLRRERCKIENEEAPGRGTVFALTFRRQVNEEQNSIG